MGTSDIEAAGEAKTIESPEAHFDDHESGVVVEMTSSLTDEQVPMFHAMPCVNSQDNR